MTLIRDGWGQYCITNKYTFHIKLYCINYELNPIFVSIEAMRITNALDENLQKTCLHDAYIIFE